jgi:cytochrome oxidase assembly protein ShyY1
MSTVTISRHICPRRGFQCPLPRETPGRHRLLRLLLTRRWLGYLALTVVFAVVASLFGVWQWDRRGQAVAAIDKVDENYDREPVALASVLDAGPLDAVASEWIPVTLEGSYLAEEQVLARTRPRSGSVGFEILVPFQAGDITVIVNRGWVSTGASQDFPDAIPRTPQGAVQLVARIKPSEPLLRGRGAPEGQIASIHLLSLQEMTSLEIREDFYVALGSESPRPASAPLPTARPELDEGPHLSYTFQWYLFAVMAFCGLWYMLRQEVRVHRGENVSRKSSRDDDEEDALLDGVGA